MFYRFQSLLLILLVLSCAEQGVMDSQEGKSKDSFTIINAKEMNIQSEFVVKSEPVYAGGPLVLEFIVENKGDKNLYLVLESDRVHGRAAGFEFTGLMTEKNLTVEPISTYPYDLGGLATFVKIEPGKKSSQRILLNDFIKLESLFELISPQEQATLMLNCQKLMQVSDDSTSVFESNTKKDTAKTELKIKIQKDNEALKRLLAHHTQFLKDNWNVGYSVELDHSLQQLTAVRLPIAIPYLKSLKGHPNAQISNKINTLLLKLEASSVKKQ